MNQLILDALHLAKVAYTPWTLEIPDLASYLSINYRTYLFFCYNYLKIKKKYNRWLRIYLLSNRSVWLMMTVCFFVYFTMLNF